MALIWGVNFSVVKYGTRRAAPLAFNGAARAARVHGARRRRPLGRSHAARGGDVRAPRAARRAGARRLPGLLHRGPRAHAGRHRGARVRGEPRAHRHRRPAARHRARRAARGWAGIALQLAGMAAVVVGSAARVRPERRPLAARARCSCSPAASAGRCTPCCSSRSPSASTAIQLSAFTMLGGVVLLGVLAVPALAVTPWSQVGRRLGRGGVQRLGALVVAYLFWYRGVKRARPDAHRDVQQPAAADRAGRRLPSSLREVPTAAQLGGAAAIMTGLLVSRREARTLRHRRHAAVERRRRPTRHGGRAHERVRHARLARLPLRRQDRPPDRARADAARGARRRAHRRADGHAARPVPGAAARRARLGRARVRPARRRPRAARRARGAAGHRPRPAHRQPRRGRAPPSSPPSASTSGASA